MYDVVATLATNYNGWSIEVDGEGSEDYEAIADRLVEVSFEDRIEDKYGDLITIDLSEESEKKILGLLRGHFGNDADITIDFDNFSS